MKLTCPSKNRLREFLEGSISDADADQITDHVEGCSSCDLVLSTLESEQSELLQELRKGVGNDSLLQEPEFKKLRNTARFSQAETPPPVVGTGGALAAVSDPVSTDTDSEPATNSAARRTSAWWRSSRRTRTSRRFLSKCQRSANCTACGAPSVAPLIYSSPRSRLMISICGCCFKYAAKPSDERVGNIAIGRRRSRSQISVP